MGTLGQMGIWNKWALGACRDWDKWTFGEIGTLRQMGTLGPMSIGASGYWNKWIFGEMSTLRRMGTLGPMSIAASGHSRQMSTWGKWAPGKMGIRVNEHQGKWAFETNGHFGANAGYLESMSIGASGHWGQMGTWRKWAL